MKARDLAYALESSWPCARRFDVGPFTLRDGQGGGKRVSAASLTNADFSHADIIAAEVAMRALGQLPLFIIWPDTPAQASFDRGFDTGFDRGLAARGYRLIDPCVGYIAPIAGILTQTAAVLDSYAPSYTQSYAHWPPLAVCNDLWQAAGVGPARRAVMGRALGPKTAVMTRQGDDITGVCFAALVGDTAMLHGIEVAPSHRRQGFAQKLLHCAAMWAQGQGAVNIGLVVTQVNTPARALYEKLGMQVWGAYHYRQLA